MATAVLKEAGGSDVDVTVLVQDASVTHQWQRPSFSTIRVPLDRVSGDWEGARLKVYPDDDELDFHGKCVHVDDQADERSGYRVATFASATEIFEFRVVRDPDGDFSKPSIIADNVTGPQIVESALTNSMVAGDPSIGEGPMGISLGTFETGGPNMTGAPTDWPMTLADLFGRLASTGHCDIVERPIESGDSMAEVSAYNGLFGDDLSSSVRFEFATGLYNARACQRERDYRELMNKLWIYGGPRVKSSADPAGDQHWRFNVTGTDGGLPDPPQSAILALIAASRALHYERIVVDIDDSANDEEDDAMRNLTRLRWQMLTSMRVRGKTLVSITPDRGIAPAFRTGDKIHVAAGTSFAGGFSGTQRVQEYSYRFSARGPIELGPPIGKGMAGRPPVMTSMDGDLP
jgi:hypothetical protein